MANTTAPLSEVAIANMAATTLDDAHLTSLDEDSNLGRFMASQFGYARDELLASHIWACAKTRVNVAKMSEAPAFGYDYQYQLPSDCLRIIPPRVDGNPTAPLIPYIREGRRILTDYCAPLRLTYIRRVTNPAELDPLFARALGQYLGLLAAQRITGKESYFEKASRLFNQAIANAHQVNALEIGTQPRYNNNDVLEARLAGC